MMNNGMPPPDLTLNITVEEGHRLAVLLVREQAAIQAARAKVRSQAPEGEKNRGTSHEERTVTMLINKLLMANLKSQLATA